MNILACGEQLNIRQLGPGDLDAAEGILKNSFTTPGNRRPELERGLRLQPKGWWLGLFGDEPVGMVGAVEYDQFAWVGMMGVTQAHQSKGIGRALMTHLLADLDTRKNMILLDASVKGRPLYESMGFQDEGMTRLYEGTEMFAQLFPGVGVPGIAGNAGKARSWSSLLKKAIKMATLADLPAIVAFDRCIFGADRTAVFQDLLASFPNRGFLAYDREGNLQGVLWAQWRRIGPWVANGPAVADLLLQGALTLKFDGVPQIIAPDVNADAAELFSRYGFSPLLGNCHMRRGGKGLTGLRTQVFGQASFAIG